MELGDGLLGEPTECVVGDDDGLHDDEKGKGSEDGEHGEWGKAQGSLLDHIHFFSFLAEKVEGGGTRHGNWLIDLEKKHLDDSLTLLDAVVDLSLLSSERLLDSSGQCALDWFAVSLADLNLASHSDRSGRVETESLHLGGLHSGRLDFDGSWDQLLGNSWGWASSVDELELLEGSGLGSGNSWLSVAVLDEEVKFVIHGHNFPAKLEDVSELGLNKWLFGSVSVEKLHQNWVSELDLSTWLDEVGFWSSDGHVVSGLNTSSEHAGVVARHLVQLIHGGDESWDSEVVGLDDDSRLVGSVEEVNESAVTELSSLSLLTELLDLLLQWSLLLLRLVLSSLVVIKVVKRDWAHSEVLWKSEDKSGGIGVGNLNTAGIELVLDEDYSAEWLSVVDLDLDSLVVADGLDGLSLDLDWWAEWHGGFWGTTVLGVLDGWLLGLLGGKQLGLRVLALDDGSGDTVLGLWDIGSSGNSSVDFLGHTEVLVEVGVLVHLGILINGVKDGAVSETTVVVDSSATENGISHKEQKDTREGQQLTGEAVEIVEINSLADLGLESVVSVEEQKVASLGLLVVVERAALLWGKSGALGYTLLDSLGSGGLENMKIVLSLWKSSIDCANSLEVLSSWALLLLEMASDVEVVDEELLSLWDEQLWLALSGFGVQDALLLVVVVHDGLAHESLSGLWWWVGALIKAHGHRWHVLHDEGGESDEDHLWNTLEAWHVAAGVWRSEALLLEVSESFGGDQVSTSEWLGPFIGEDASAGLVVVHEGLAVEVVRGD